MTLAIQPGMKIPIAILLLGHGFAHLVGFVGAWQLAPGKVPHVTAFFGGRIAASEVAVRVLGAFWLLAAVAFAVIAGGALLAAPWWTSAALATAAASLTLCVVFLPEAKIGVAVNLAVVVLVALASRAGWLT